MTTARGRWWPAACALLLGVASLVSTGLEYRRLLEKHSWTAASVTLGLGVFLALASAGLGVALGRLLRRAATAEDRAGRTKAALAAVAIVALVLFVVVRSRAAREREARLEAIRAETLTLERALALAGGDPDEQRAEAYNRTCPPEVLARLADSPDQGVRANVGGNPNSPAAVVSALSRGPDELVRYYTAYNPALPLADLQALTRDPSREVSRSASETLQRRTVSSSP